MLYVHGARDPRWAEPFERLRDMVATRASPTVVSLAFLEHAMPDLVGAATAMADAGVRSIKVVPMFFGRGGHLRDDFPRQIANAKAQLPDVRFEITAAAGEDDAVLAALARFAVEATGTPSP